VASLPLIDFLRRVPILLNGSANLMPSPASVKSKAEAMTGAFGSVDKDRQSF
jgi:hypothetical protein